MAAKLSVVKMQTSWRTCDLDSSWRPRTKRVGTDHSIAVARRITARRREKVDNKVTFSRRRTFGAHYACGAPAKSAEWIVRHSAFRRHVNEKGHETSDATHTKSDAKLMRMSVALCWRWTVARRHSTRRQGDRTTFTSSVATPNDTHALAQIAKDTTVARLGHQDEEQVEEAGKLLL